jgi:hypothetical protein
MIGQFATAATRLALVPDGIGRTGDNMGAAVALYGDTAAVGIPQAQPTPFIDSGAIAVFRNGATGWAPEATLEPDDPVNQLGFGSSLGIGPDMIVTAGSLPTGESAIYTYVRAGSQWSLSDTFTVQGYSQNLALSGNTLIASATETYPASPAGVFVRVGNAWVQQTNLTGADPNEQVVEAAIDGDIVASIGKWGTAFFVHFYARSGATFTLENTVDVTYEANDEPPVLAISGQTVLVGFQNDPLGNVVSAWVRDQATWTLQGTLDSGGTYNGISLAIDGDEALVGSPFDDVLGVYGAGTAYEFTRSSGVWTRVAHFYDASFNYNSYFGAALALTGSTALIGSPGAFTDDAYTGKATFFTSDSGTWSEGASFDDGNAHAEASFGTSVGTSGSTIVVGAPQARSALGGAAYVFEQSGGTWLEQATLLPSVYVSRGFGTSVALNGDTAAVGANYETTPDDGGAAYVFTRAGGTWPLQARLTTAGSTFFGWSVALVGEWLAVGDPGAVNGDCEQLGIVHIFNGSGADWIEQAALTPSISSVCDEFGYSMAMSGDTLLVGAPLADDGIETDAGMVFVFVNSGLGWTEQARLEAPLVGSDAHFGRSVVVQGDTAVVGSGEESYPYMSRGAAYVYTRTGGTWSWQATLVPPIQPPIPGSYGFALALSADESTIVVGMPELTNGPGDGEAFVFVRDGDTWDATWTLQAPESTNPGPNDEFGTSLAFSSGDVVVGAPLDGTGGAVYVAGFGDEIFAGNFDPAP